MASQRCGELLARPRGTPPRPFLLEAPMPPSRALADLEMDEATLLDHLAAIERMLFRRHQ